MKKINRFLNYPTPTAAIVPFGMLMFGCRRSPLILIPAIIPVTVGKKTPNAVNQLYPSKYSANELFARFPDIHPSKPCSVQTIQNIIIFTTFTYFTTFTNP